MQVAADKLPDALHRYPHFETLQRLCFERDAWLVGGALRDALLARPLTDLDLIFPRDPTPLARRFAQQIGGYWFWLDRDRRQSRVLASRKNHSPCFDFALFRAEDLHGDLLDRDFTINAMALPMGNALDPASIVDPFHGLDDLQSGLLRMVSNSSLTNDPLRIIKGVRHATCLKLQIDSLTLDTMQQTIEAVDSVAPERLRQEVWKIFADRNAGAGFELLQTSGAGGQLFGENFASCYGTMSRKLALYRCAWFELVSRHPVARAWFEQEFEQGLCGETLLLWSLLLNDVAPQLPLSLAEQWRFSRKTRAAIHALSALTVNVLEFLPEVAYNQRAFAWWADRLRLAPKMLLPALVAINAVQQKLPQQSLFDRVPLADALDGARPADLVDGHWLRAQLGIADGPAMNSALHMLRDAEISGRITGPEQAKQFLVCHFQNKH